MLTKKWAFRQPVLLSGGVRIPVMRAVKYLGITLDSKLTFTHHIRAVSAAAKASVLAIGRFMPNISGPSMAKRRLLVSVINSKILYAATVWTLRASRYEVNKTTMAKAQRLAALRVTRCYWTVSTTAATFLAGIPPADLLAAERESVRMLKRSFSGTDLNSGHH